MHIPLNTFRESVALATSISALVVAAIYCFCRIGLSDDLAGPVLLSLGLSWFLINLPFAVKQLWARARTSSSWLASDGSLSLLGLSGVMLLGMFFGKTAGAALAICGALFLLWRCGDWLKQHGIWQARGSLFWGSLLGVCLACWIWGDGYHDPLFRWKMFGQDDRALPADPLIHACWSNMIRTYGVPSSGLDGVPYYPYHFGSHFLFAQLGQLLDLPGIDVYQLTYPVVFLPLLAHSVLLAGLAFAQPMHGAVFPSQSLIWLTLLVGFTGVLPFSSIIPAGTLTTSDLTSESMCTALIVMLLGLAAGAPLFRKREAQARITISTILASLSFPTFVAVLGFLKFSVMAVVLGASMLVFVTMARFRRSWLAGFSLAVACGAFLGVCHFVLEPLRQKEASALFPFAYLRVWVDPTWRAYYFPLELLIVLGAITLRLWQEDCVDVEGLIRAWHGGELADVGFVAFAAILSFGPGLVLDAQGAAAVYFTHIQRWIALPILLGVLLSPSRQPDELLSLRGRWLQLPLWKAGAWFLMLAVGATLALNTLSRARTLVRTNLSDRGFQQSDQSEAPGAIQRSSVTKALRHGRIGRAYAMIREQTTGLQSRRDPEAQTVRMLDSLYGLPKVEKRVTLLYIPRTNRAFWDLLGTNSPPWMRPLMGPALSGLALLDGLPDPEDIPANGLNGYAAYDRSQAIRLPSDRTKDALCRRAERMGFRRILVLEVTPDGTVCLDEWCFRGAQPLFNGVTQQLS
jgi:hypothetical protein